MEVLVTYFQGSKFIVLINQFYTLFMSTHLSIFQQCSVRKLNGDINYHMISSLISSLNGPQHHFLLLTVIYSLTQPNMIANMCELSKALGLWHQFAICTCMSEVIISPFLPSCD